MPLATALIVAAAAYQAQKNSEKNGGDADSGSEPITAAFLENKTSVELLPLEQKLAIYEHPISTVSFYEFVSDSMDDVIQKLESRIHVVVSASTAVARLADGLGVRLLTVGSGRGWTSFGQMQDPTSWNGEYIYPDDGSPLYTVVPRIGTALA